MVNFREMYGAVYIFENPEAKRVKVGMTINHVADRLQSVNEMWLERRVTCQACGGRRFANDRGLVPQHPSSQHGRPCPGSNALPLEKDLSLAEAHLENLKNRHSELSGSERLSDQAFHLRLFERDGSEGSIVRSADGSRRLTSAGGDAGNEFFDFDAPRQQRLDVFCAGGFGKLLEDMIEISPGLYPVGLCGFDETVESRARRRATRSVGEHPVPSTNHKGADAALDGVRIQGDPRVVENSHEF